MPPLRDWFVYVVRCKDLSLYTGIAHDLPSRLARHNAGTGARYTRSRRPVVLVYAETALSRSAALRREFEIKRLSTAQKRDLIGGSQVDERSRPVPAPPSLHAPSGPRQPTQGLETTFKNSP